MNRKAFIQHCMHQAFPRLMAGELTYEQARRGAERLWRKLTEDGYGDAKAKPESVNDSAYASMEPDDRALFDRFWTAFGKHGHREEAARAWVKIKDRVSLADQIIAAAEMDRTHHQNNPDTARKHAMGWLNARRWETYEVTEKRQQSEHSQRERQLRDLTDDIRQLQTLYDKTGDESLHQQIEAKRQKLRELR